MSSPIQCHTEWFFVVSCNVSMGLIGSRTKRYDIFCALASTYHCSVVSTVDRMPMKNETNSELIVLQAIQSVLLSEELNV